MSKRHRFVFQFVFLVNLIHAQQLVFDPLNIVEAASQTAQLIESVANQITMIEQQIEEAERQIKMVTQLPARLYNTTVEFMEEQINKVENIAARIEGMVIDVKDQVVDAHRLFLSNIDYSYWASDDPQARKELIERDLERSALFREINKQLALEAQLVGQDLANMLSESYERINETYSDIANSDSLVQNIQATNQIGAETFNLLGEMAKMLSTMSQSITSANYQQGEYFLSTINSICRQDEIRDLFSNACIERDDRELSAIISEGFIHADEYGNTLYNQALEEVFQFLGP